MNPTTARAAELWVALLLPFSDGSGDTVVLGVWGTQEGAQACCWRELDELGYDRPTAVVPVAMNVDA